MRKRSRYVLPLITLLLAVLGAAMPWLASWMQDARISGFQERLELNAVNLTLQQDGSVEEALQIAASDCEAILWEDRTNLTWEEAFEEARRVVAKMGSYDLLGKNELRRLEKTGGQAEPYLLVTKDGASALVWTCWWNTEGGLLCAVTVDDATGKAVRILALNGEEVISSDLSQTNDLSQTAKNTYMRLEKWLMFLEGYYGIIPSNVEEWTERTEGGLVSRFDIGFAEEEGEELCEMRLNMYESGVSFNY